MLQSCFGKEVTGKLPDDEFVKWEVFVEGTNHPVTVRVDAAFVIQMETMGVTVTNCIKPVSSLMFSIARALHQRFEIAWICSSCLVAQEARQDSGFGGQASEGKGRSPRQGSSITHGGEVRLLSELFNQLGFDEAVDRMLSFGVFGNCARVLAHRSHKRPVLGIVAALLGPS